MLDGAAGVIRRVVADTLKDYRAPPRACQSPQLRQLGTNCGGGDVFIGVCPVMGDSGSPETLMAVASASICFYVGNL